MDLITSGYVSVRVSCQSNGVSIRGPIAVRAASVPRLLFSVPFLKFQLVRVLMDFVLNI